MKRAATSFVLAAMLLTSCGLKVPVTNFVGAAAPAKTGSQGDPIADPKNPEGVTGPANPDAVNSTAANPTAGPGGAVGTGTSAYNFSSETEGVTKDQITLCTHVPITGAAPIPHNSARFGQFFWDSINKEKGGVFGRKVRMLAFDDQYYPAGARAAVEKCKQQGTFIYLGAAGTDQIVSVAKWAESNRVPYLHGPTSDKDLHGFKYDVSTGPDYETQSRLLADYQVKRFGTKVAYGMIRINSPYFDSAHDAYKAELQKKGVTLAVDRQVQKDESQFADLLFELKQKNVQVINNFTTPNIWIKILNTQNDVTYNPWWTAISPIAGFNIVAAALSKAHARAVVFSHFNPACHCTYYDTDLDTSAPYLKDEQEFLRIFKKYSPEQTPRPDDFDYSSYLAAKGLYRLLLAIGNQPTRTKLFDLLKGYKEINSSASVFPSCGLDFTRSPADRRNGALKVNVFELDVNKWKQIESCTDAP